MRVAVVGLGAVGIRAARQLASTPEVEALLLRDPRSGRADEVAAAIGAVARVDHTTELPDTDVVVLAGPCRHPGRRSPATPSPRGATWCRCPTTSTT